MSYCRQKTLEISKTDWLVSRVFWRDWFTLRKESGKISRCMIFRMVSAAVPTKRRIPNTPITPIIALSSGSSVTLKSHKINLQTSTIFHLQKYSLSSSAVWQLRGYIQYGNGMLASVTNSFKKLTHPCLTSSSVQTLGIHLPCSRKPPDAKLWKKLFYLFNNFVYFLTLLKSCKGPAPSNICIDLAIFPWARLPKCSRSNVKGKKVKGPANNPYL